MPQLSRRGGSKATAAGARRRAESQAPTPSMAAQGLVPIVLVLSQVLQGSPEKVNSHTTAPSLTPILPAPRHSSRRQNRLILQSPDFCDALGRELVLSGCGLGGLAFRTASASGAFASPSMQSFATPAVPAKRLRFIEDVMRALFRRQKPISHDEEHDGPLACFV